MKHNSNSRNAVLLEKRRFEAIRMFKQHESQADIARKLSVSRQAVSVWVRRHQSKGRNALKASRATGRPTKTDFKILSSKLGPIILKGPKSFGYETDLWTTALIRDILNSEIGVSYHRDHVWKILRKAGFSCQKPERRAIQRNERFIRRWIRNVWPDIKKKPENTRL